MVERQGNERKDNMRNNKGSLEVMKAIRYLLTEALQFKILKNKKYSGKGGNILFYKLNQRLG
jgi:hypothetical protein